MSCTAIYHLIFCADDSYFNVSLHYGSQLRHCFADTLQHFIRAFTSSNQIFWSDHSSSCRATTNLASNEMG